MTINNIIENNTTTENLYLGNGNLYARKGYKLNDKTREKEVLLQNMQEQVWMIQVI